MKPRVGWKRCKESSVECPLKHAALHLRSMLVTVDLRMGRS